MKCPWYVFIPMTWLEVFSLSLYYLVLVLPAWQGPTSSKPKPRRAHTWGRQWGGRSPALLHADLLSRSPRPSRAALGRAGLREAEAAHGHRGDLRSPGRAVHGGARLPHAPALPRRPGPAQGLPGSTAARPPAGEARTAPRRGLRAPAGLRRYRAPLPSRTQAQASRRDPARPRRLQAVLLPAPAWGLPSARPARLPPALTRRPTGPPSGARPAPAPQRYRPPSPGAGCRSSAAPS